ncbi:hypothetical protein SGLAM104S_00958 [Streptomyces glaucescens]
MAVRAVRGAVQLERDNAERMDAQVGALLTAILERNGLTADDLISIWLAEATPDLHSDFPAAAARGLGIVDVPLICAQELDIEGAMPAWCGSSPACVRPAPRRHPPRLPRRRRRSGQGHRPVRTAAGHRRRPDRHLRRPGPRPAWRHRPPRRPRPRAGPHRRRAQRRHPSEAPDGPVDLAVVAAPPAHVAAVLADAMQRGVARGYVDVASVKGGPRRELEALRPRPVVVHPHPPMSGREKSGPLAATGDLFEGRPWLGIAHRDTDTEVLNLALELVSHCRAVPVVMDADAHDRAVALVSRMPHLVSSMVAARLEHAEEAAVRLRQGMRDVAGSPPPTPGCGSTSSPRSPAGRRPHGRLRRPRRRYAPCVPSSPPTRPSGARAPRASRTCCGAGDAGQVRVPGKHGSAPRVYETVAVLIDDQPGQLARVFRGRRAGRGQHRGRADRARDKPPGRSGAAVVEAKAVAVSLPRLRERGWAMPSTSWRAPPATRSTR